MRLALSHEPSSRDGGIVECMGGHHMSTARQDVVLVTGASVGIGLALARQLIDMDYRLILTARASSLNRFEEAGIEQSERVWLRALM